MSCIPHDEESRAELVAATLAKLAPADRLLLQLRYFDDFTCDALAANFGITRDAIHVRLHRAREHFRVMLME